jgi:hypothetical protein
VKSIVIFGQTGLDMLFQLAIELMREDLKCDSIVFPSMVCGIHGRIEIEPLSSVGGSLIIMELIKRNCLRIVVIRNMESYTVISPAVA